MAKFRSAICIARVLRYSSRQGRCLASEPNASSRRFRLPAAEVENRFPVGLAGCRFGDMFTIEHDFDATVITLMDEGGNHLQEDVTINAFEDCVTLEQLDPRSGEVLKLTLSMSQLRELGAALNLPEGVYRLSEET